ncbi:MAG: helix-turn-helix transcriptional regulator [Dehalococcoidia bacterium]
MEAQTPREWLILLQEKTGLTAKGLAEAVGVSHMSIHRWKQDGGRHVPTLAHARILARLAGTTVDEVARVFEPQAAAA